MKDIISYIKEYNALHKSKEERNKEEVSFNDIGVGRGLPKKKSHHS